MNANHAMHQWKNAMNGLGLAMEYLYTLEPGDRSKVIAAADLLDKAWKDVKRLTPTTRDALLERLGW